MKHPRTWLPRDRGHACWRRGLGRAAAMKITPALYAAPEDRGHAGCATAVLGPLARETANHRRENATPDPTLNPACPRTTTCGSYLARDPARVAPLRVAPASSSSSKEVAGSRPQSLVR